MAYLKHNHGYFTSNLCNFSKSPHSYKIVHDISFENLNNLPDGDTINEADLKINNKEPEGPWPPDYTNHNTSPPQASSNGPLSDVTDIRNSIYLSKITNGVCPSPLANEVPTGFTSTKPGQSALRIENLEQVRLDKEYLLNRSLSCDEPLYGSREERENTNNFNGRHQNNTSTEYPGVILRNKKRRPRKLPEIPTAALSRSKSTCERIRLLNNTSSLAEELTEADPNLVRTESQTSLHKSIISLHDETVNRLSIASNVSFTLEELGSPEHIEAPALQESGYGYEEVFGSVSESLNQECVRNEGRASRLPSNGNMSTSTGSVCQSTRGRLSSHEAHWQGVTMHYAGGEDEDEDRLSVAIDTRNRYSSSSSNEDTHRHSSISNSSETQTGIFHNSGNFHQQISSATSSQPSYHNKGLFRSSTDVSLQQRPLEEEFHAKGSAYLNIEDGAVASHKAKIGGYIDYIDDSTTDSDIETPKGTPRRHRNDVNCNERPTTPQNGYLSAQDVSRKAFSVITAGLKCGTSPGNGSSAYNSECSSTVDPDDLEPTHRGCHKFIPRHVDEMYIEIGDPIYVTSESDDLWCEGINLRSGKRGIFPLAYATDLTLLEDDPDKPFKIKVKFLGSVEVNKQRGNDVLCKAINKVVQMRRTDHKSSPVCNLEVNEFGVKMSDTGKKSMKPLSPKESLKMRLARILSREKNCDPGDEINHFFSLKNISFCGYHPKNDRYFAFITKHPMHLRFAAHVFSSEKSTQCIAAAIGDAFTKFYQQYLAFVHPTEDIYIE